VTSLGDQQIFTGLAYFFAFGFADYSFRNSCTISIYHYIIAGNILVLLSSTNLVVWSITNRLWKEPLAGLMRACLLALMLLQAALIIGSIEPPIAADPTILLPAVCGTDEALMSGMINETVPMTQLWESIFSRAGGGTGKRGIELSRVWIATILWFVLAGVVDISLLIGFWGFRKKLTPWIPTLESTSHGTRAKINKMSMLMWAVPWIKNPDIARSQSSCYGLRRGIRVRIVFGSTLVLYAGAWMIGIAGIATTRSIIFELRSWLRDSEWVEIENGRTAEDNPGSFGQLMAIMTLVAVFWSAQMAGTRKWL
jgi:hypothetical protein